MKDRTCIRCGNTFRADNGGRGQWARYCSQVCASTPKPKPDLPVCTVPDCSRPANRMKRTMCEAHYYRLRRNGTLVLTQPRRPQRGTCTVDGCDKRDRGPHGLCAKHATRQRRHGSVDAVHPTGAPAGPDHPCRQGDNIKNRAAHERLNTMYGKAKTHTCVDCGKQAAHWSYDHQDPNENHDPVKGPYSTDPERYQPRCVPCHKAFDLAYLSRRGTP